MLQRRVPVTSVCMLDFFQKNKRLLAALSLAILLSQLLVSAYFCRDNFCADDSFRYKNILDDIATKHSINPIDKPVLFLAGFPVFLLMLPLRALFDSVWAIRIASALASVLFFLVFSNLLSRFLSGRWAIGAAFLSVFSFWWTQLSFGLYKNELGLVFLLLAVLLLLDWLHSKNKGLPVLPALAFLCIAPVHITTFYFAVLSLLIFGLILMLGRKSVAGAALSAFSIVIVAFVGVQLLPGSSSPVPGSGLLMNVFFLLALPFAFYGFYQLGKTSKPSAALLANSPIPADWAWRFLLNGFWAVFAGLCVAFSHYLPVFGHRSKSSQGWRVHALTLLASVSLFSYLAVAVPAFIVLHDQCSQYEERLLASSLAQYHPAAIYITPSLQGFGNIIALLQYRGFLGGFPGEFCPAPNETGPDSFELYNLDSYADHSTIRGLPVSDLKKNNSGSRFYWMKCLSSESVH